MPLTPLGEQLEPLRHQVDGEKLKPVRLPPGRARLATKPDATGATPTTKTWGSDVFRRAGRRGALARDHVDLAPNEIGGQRGQLFKAIIGSAVFNR